MSDVEIWFRDPHSYVRECVKAGVSNLIWKYGTLAKYDIDAHRHACHYYPENRNFRVAVIGDQGMVVMDRHHNIFDPLAVYPVWTYGEHRIETLESWMASDCTPEMRERAMAEDRPTNEIPVIGQAHCVALNSLPNAKRAVEKKFWNLLAELQGDYPDCTLHIHGGNTFSRLCSGSFKSVDFYPRTQASMGLILPNGRSVTKRNMRDHMKWIHLLGFTITELQDPKMRCIFNIKAMEWAAENWNNRDDISSRPGPLSIAEVGVLARGGTPEPKLTKRPTRSRGKMKPLPGDKLYCGACSFADTCHLYREGSVCTVPSTDVAKLVELFGSRDSTKIIEGLGALISFDLERLEEGREHEVENNELDPHVTKIGDAVFKHGTTLAKLIDPSLRSAAVAINVGKGAAISVGEDKTPQALASQAVAALEAGGVPRDQITVEMIQKCIATGGNSTDLELIIASEAAKYSLPSFDEPIDIDP